MYQSMHMQHTWKLSSSSLSLTYFLDLVLLDQPEGRTEHRFRIRICNTGKGKNLLHFTKSHLSNWPNKTLRKVITDSGVTGSCVCQGKPHKI